MNRKREENTRVLNCGSLQSLCGHSPTALVIYMPSPLPALTLGVEAWELILVVASLRPVWHTRGCSDVMFFIQAPSTQITTQKARRGTEEMVKITHVDNSKRWQRSKVPELLHGTSSNVIMEICQLEDTFEG